jgi:hypothetical protein
MTQIVGQRKCRAVILRFTWCVLFLTKSLFDVLAADKPNSISTIRRYEPARLEETSPVVTAIAAQTNTALPVLTSITQVIGLTREQARQRYPVRLTGVLIHNDPQWKQLFIQEGDEGLYLYSGNQTLDIRTGRRIEVTGTTESGGVLTMVSPVNILDRGEAL